MKRVFFLLLTLCCAVSPLLAQDSLLIKALSANRLAFSPASGESFSGAGWDKLTAEAQASQYFLIGEVHGIQELPMLIEALSRKVSYETFVTEVDPWLATLLEKKAKEKPGPQLEQWRQENGEFLSFFSYQQDFRLLQSLTSRNVRLAGIDQITLLNDVPVFRHLASITPDKKRKAAYLKSAETSASMIRGYGAGKSKDIYLASAQAGKDLKELGSQSLAGEEKEIVEALQLSHRIYTEEGSHNKRIQLMKSQLMEYYRQGKLNGKCLFRLGAMHCSRHESFFTIFDIGNLAHNLAESQYNKSYHVAVLAKSGEAGVPFKGMPAGKMETEKELDIIYQLASDDSWTYLDLRPARKQLEKHQLEITNDMLRKLVKGYDSVIIIPRSQASNF